MMIQTIAPAFDRPWYLAQYPEAGPSGLDPVVHYVLVGAAKGFDPTPHFDSKAYIAANGDMRQSGWPPFAHWLWHGRAEPVARRTGGAGAIHHAMFSIVLDCHGKSGPEIERSLQSLMGQSHRNFEILLPGARTPPRIAPQARPIRGIFAQPALAAPDLLKPGGLDQWRGDYLLIMEAGDILHADALARINAHAHTDDPHRRMDLVVFDYIRDTDGKPRFLPGFDPDLLEVTDYLHGACAIARTYLEQSLPPTGAGGIREALLTTASPPPLWSHIPEPLARLARRSEPPPAPLPAHAPAPAVSIIVPNRNRRDLLGQCTAFLAGFPSAFELIIVDNASDDAETLALYRTLEQDFGARVIHADHRFNYARMVNLGAAAARHEFLLLLNNDVFISDPASLLAALHYAARDGVGIVGSLLRYPDGTVQHAGMVGWLSLDDRLRSDHVMRHRTHDEAGFIGTLSAPRNWQFVTGAFHLVRKRVFEAVDGYDECNLPVEYNDVDFCCRVRALGLRVVCLPLAGIVHDESSTRRHMAQDDAAMSRGQAVAIMAERWRDAFLNDPYHHPKLFALHQPRPLAPPGKANPAPANSHSPDEAATDTRSPWRPRKLRPGLSIVGFMQSEIGIGEAARNLFRAGDAARLPVSCVNRLLPRRNNEPGLATVCQPFPDRLASLWVEGLGETGHAWSDAASRRINIYYPFWELPRIPAEFIPRLDQFDEIWAPSEFIADALREATRRPVRLVRQPLFVPPDMPPQAPPASTLRFLTYFDYDSFLARKNPQGAIRAFRAAFPGREDVSLIVKARGIGNATARSLVDEAIGGDPRIRLIDQTVSRADMHALFAQCDAFISLHRSEGFGFGAAEALAAGKAVIATDWSGTRDFINASTAYLVAFRPVPLKEGEYAHTSGQHWAEPCIDSAVAQLRHMAENREEAIRKARAGHALLLSRHSYEAVGRHIGAALKDIGAW